MAAKGEMQVPIEYKSRFLRPCEASLIFVGKKAGTTVGSTLVFTLKGSVETVLPSVSYILITRPSSLRMGFI